MEKYLFKDLFRVFLNPLFWVLILSAILRLIYLSEIPPGIANDEINIVMNAQSFLKTFHNIPGVVTGLFGTTSGDLSGGIHSEISSYLLIPWILLFGFSWPWVKLPFIFAGIGIVFLSYLLAKKFVSKEAGLISALLTSISPWNIFFSRSAYESILSAFFYLLAIYLFLKLRGWKALWSLPIFLLGFLSYFSAKTLLLPIALVMLITFKLFNATNSLKTPVVLNILVTIFLIVYSLLLPHFPAGSRIQELQSQNTSTTVNLKRTASLDLGLNSIYENKLTEDLKIRLKASLGIFLPSFLFIDGQPESIPSLSIPDHGPLYLIDFPFIIIGIYFLARRNKKTLILLLSLSACTLLPNFLNLAGTTYMIRTVILFPILTIISALGIYYLLYNTKGFLKKGLLCLITAGYLIFFGNFLFQYFGRLPIERNEGWFLQRRILSNYLRLNSLKNPDQSTIVISSEPKHTFYTYLFFNKLYSNFENIDIINQNLALKNYKFSNIDITGQCPGAFDINHIYFIDTDTKCRAKYDKSISSLKDGGQKYLILNDKLCNNFSSNKYPLIKNIHDLDIEKMSTTDFCQKFIVNPQATGII